MAITLDGTLGITTSAVVGTAATGALIIPSGTTAQRPAPSTGMTRYNTTISSMEFYNGSVWTTLFLQQYTAAYLVVAGGGGGNGGNGGGGGAGGYIAGTTLINTGVVYSIMVGAGGAGEPSTSLTPIGAGSNSQFGQFATAIGGGYGGSRDAYAASSGGSGGGGGSQDPPSFSSIGHAGTPGQGYAGANGIGAPNYRGGGGGGASGAATNQNGAAGLDWQALGTYYGGGGGAGANSGPGSGGTGGGGAGTGLATATSGTANTGGGGGSASAGGSGGSGGSGVVVLLVPTINYSGVTTGSPTVTTSGANTIIKFTASGSYTA